MSHLIRALFPTSFSTRFFKVIHLVICSHKYKVWDHHMIQIQTTHREWVIIYLTKIWINKDISKINYRNIYYLTQLNTIHVTSPLYLFYFIISFPNFRYIIYHIYLFMSIILFLLTYNSKIECIITLLLTKKCQRIDVCYG